MARREGARRTTRPLIQRSCDLRVAPIAMIVTRPLNCPLPSLRIPLLVLLVGLAWLMPARTSSESLSPGLYRLHDHRDGRAAPPRYGLRLDGLQTGDADDVFSFDFDAPGAAVFLELAPTSAHLFGTVYGGKDVGDRFESPELWDLEMRYALADPSGATGRLESVGSPGSNTGTLRRRSDGRVFTLEDFGGPPSFVIGSGHRTPADVFSGWGWLKHSGAPAHVPDSDWLFEIASSSRDLRVGITNPSDGATLRASPIEVRGTWSDGRPRPPVAPPPEPSFLLLPLDEGEGIVAHDATGRGRDGLLEPSPTWVDGPAGSTLDFDGRDDRLTLTAGGHELEGLSALTVSLWLQSDQVGVDRGLLDTRRRATGHDDHLSLRYDAAGWGGGGTSVLKAGLRTTAGSSQIESSSYTQTKGWQHVALRWESGGEIELYLDGRRDATSYSQGPIGGTITGVETLIVGRGPKGRTWDGRIDGIRIDDRALAPGEIAGLAAAGPALAAPDAPPPRITLNGIEASVGDGDFVAVGVPVVEGPSRLTAIAEAPDDPATSAQDSIGVVLDSRPPIVHIALPADGAQLEVGPVRVAGWVEDASPIEQFTLNGTLLSLTPDTEGPTSGEPDEGPTNLVRSRFETILELAEGRLDLEARATDLLGWTGHDRISIEGGVADDPGEDPGEEEPEDPSDDDPGETPGEMPETEPLALRILTPPDGAIVSSARIDVTGSVSEPTAAVTLDGVAATVDANRWTVSAVALVEGGNLLQATATRASETASDSSHVRFNAPPRIMITSPRDEDRLRSEVVDVEGHVDDPAALTDVNGVSARVDSGGRFLALAVPLEPGPNRLVARAIDPFGALGRDEVGVRREEAGAGRLRVVLVSALPEREDQQPGLDEEPETLRYLVVEDGDGFAEALRAAGFPPEQFEPPVSEPAHSRGSFHLFVFAELGVLGEPVRVPAISSFFFNFPDARPLRPISQLEDELEEAGLFDDDLQDRLLPSDFEADGFARFSLFGGPTQ